MFHKTITKWTLLRAIRLFLGIFMIVQSIDLQNYWLILPGAIFVGMSLFNVGCGNNGCSIPTKNNDENE